jgi:ribosome maturation factor RimP
MSQADAVTSVIEPVLATRGLELVDVEVRRAGPGRMLRVVVDREGGVDLAALSSASEVISPLLDDLSGRGGELSGPYTLEVTSPGLERPLRRPDHFRRAVGETVVVKTGDPEPQRHRGLLASADDDGIDLMIDGEPLHLTYDAVHDARTVFEWGPKPKPSRGTRQKASHA